jgi:selenocysteine-specific elongation factor
MFDRVVTLLTTCGRDEPWAMGLTSLALSRALRETEAIVIHDLKPAVDDGRLIYRDGYYALPHHEPRLSAAQRAFFEERISIDPANPFQPVLFEALRTEVKRAPIVGLSRAFDTLLGRGELVRIGEALYRGGQLAAAQDALIVYLRANGGLTPAQFRDLLGTSRRFAVPLLERFDAIGVTQRSGDAHILRPPER